MRMLVTVLRSIALVLPLASEALRLDLTEVADLEEHLQSQCTTREVTDAVLCGVTSITSQITDVLACPPKKQCRKVWRRTICVDVPQICTQNIDSPNSCNVTDTCPVTISATLAGSGAIDSLLDVNVHADIIKIAVESGHEAAKNMINSNIAMVTPLLNTVAEMGLVEVNNQIRLAVDRLKTQVLDQLEKANVGKYFSVLNNVDANKALRSIVDKTWDSIGGNIKPRKQLEKAKLRRNWRKRLCHRQLRLRVENGSTYLLENWTDAVFARKFDEDKECDTVYSAQCGRGIVVKRKQCPFKEDVVKSYCLFGVACPRRKYTIRSSPTKTVSIALPDGSMDMEVDRKVWVDHVKKDTLRSYTLETDKDKADTVTVLSDVDTQPEDLDEQIDITVPGFQETIVRDMCTNAGDGSWFPFAGAFRRWRCKGVVNTVCHVARWRGKIPIPGFDSLMVKISLKKDLSLSFVPDWSLIEELVVDSLTAALSKLKLPMNARVSKINLALGGNGANIEIKPESQVFVTADIDMQDAGGLMRQLGQLGSV